MVYTSCKVCYLANGTRRWAAASIMAAICADGCPSLQTCSNEHLQNIHSQSRCQILSEYCIAEGIMW